MFKFRNYKIVTIFALLLVSVCQLPENQSPVDYVLLGRLLRPENIPDYRLSLFLDGREYRPGERLELGTGTAFNKKIISVIARNTGKFGFTLNPNGPPIITSTTSGNLQIQTESNPPNPWQPGMEFTLQLHVTPDGISQNLWNLTIQATEPAPTDFSFELSMLSLSSQPKKLFFSASNPSPGLFSFDWNPVTKTLESEVQHSVGSPGSAFLIAQAQRNKFIYYKDSATNNLIGKTLDASGTLQNLPSVAVGGYTQFQEINNQNRFLALNVSSQMSTMTFDPETGTLGALQPTIGNACFSDNIFVTPKGDFVVQPYPAAGFGRVQVSRVQNDGTLFNLFAYYQDANLSNRLDWHFKTLNNDYLYAFTRVNDPNVAGGFNYKIDNVLRRTLFSDGSISNVNAEYTLNSYGAKYLRSVRHPNDKFIYLLGNSPSNLGFIKVLNHNIETGDISVVQDVVRNSTISANEGAISPDGTLFATIHWVNNSGTCPATCLRMFIIYEINPSNGSLTEIYSLQQSKTLTGIEWLGSRISN